MDRLDDDADVKAAFGDHVHWGYWEEPSLADGTIADYAKAAESLSRRLYEKAQIHDGDRILDVGCGFGGTISSLNKKFSDLELTGLNIDERQIEVAKASVVPANENDINFVIADAVELPFEDDSFDVVMAVECIFHFSSRKDFLSEVKRVLRPGGRLVLSDFNPVGAMIFESLINICLRDMNRLTYGDINLVTWQTYRKLFKELGFGSFKFYDVSKNTYPTYRALRSLPQLTSAEEVRKTNKFMERMSRWKLFRYTLISAQL
ncbi:MAG: methyltransferase domain-containing protein [Verrucomicrobiota bacterium]